ncbi:PTS system mannose/fructose/N-acetylgalactosamine-transporter subunit IIB [Thermoanaerobacterium thermosaccharolyticum]|uniref:Phosphotransferase system, mannose/fructose/N-acetylgalactosamine-specific component IIB n=1 Tax=Thermoanaerobacterium thermosaccharolyticum M0795 TaxID=698948 RepID=L0IN32_THETR|nr:PTS sugar transporter subunit IIB [Thermoanaerobacterium thermosaccharolyticum]AGB19362.1 phosphotransferase system, mannose/fructose/N-acetylgalactosamine-specific component IIB [Thermoanaerobacterium thermosaccharolyticum M0795]
MLNIVLTRIDDRLIHGQIMAAWSKVTQAKRIIIIDDLIAKDSFMGKVLKMAAPPGMKIEVYNVKDSVNIINSNGNQNEKVIILAKSPKTILDIINSGVNIKELNVGGMGAGPGRKVIFRTISISSEEKNIFKEIINKGVNVFIKLTPDDKEVEMKRFIN